MATQRDSRRVRLLALFAVSCVALVVVAALGFATVAPEGRVGRSPAHPPPGPVALVAFGDSLAAGLCARHGSDFLALIARDLRAARPRSTLENRARSGARVADVRRQILAGPERADAVVVLVGANDVRRGTWPPAFAAAFRGSLDLIHERYPSAAVVVFGVPDIAVRPALVAPPVVPFYSTLTRWYDAIERRAASDRAATFLDFFALSRRPEANARGNVCPDGVHPTDAGHAVLAREAGPVLRAALQYAAPYGRPPARSNG